MVKGTEIDHLREKQDPHRTVLFLLRVWIGRDDESQGPEDLSGKLQDPVSGRVQYFSGEEQLVRILRRMVMLKEAGSPGQATDGDQP